MSETIELVKDCIVEIPNRFDLARVLHHAQQDRDFVLDVAEQCEMPLSV